MVRQKTANLKTAVLTSVNGPYDCLYEVLRKCTLGLVMFTVGEKDRLQKCYCSHTIRVTNNYVCFFRLHNSSAVDSFFPLKQRN